MTVCRPRNVNSGSDRPLRLTSLTLRAKGGERYVLCVGKRQSNGDWTGTIRTEAIDRVASYVSGAIEPFLPGWTPVGFALHLPTYNGMGNDSAFSRLLSAELRAMNAETAEREARERYA